MLRHFSLTFTHSQHHLLHLLQQSLLGFDLLFQLFESASADSFNLLGNLFTMPMNPTI